MDVNMLPSDLLSVVLEEPNKNNGLDRTKAVPRLISDSVTITPVNCNNPSRNGINGKYSSKRRPSSQLNNTASNKRSAKNRKLDLFKQFPPALLKECIVEIISNSHTKKSRKPLKVKNGPVRRKYRSKPKKIERYVEEEHDFPDIITNVEAVYSDGEDNNNTNVYKGRNGEYNGFFIEPTGNGGFDDYDEDDDDDDDSYGRLVIDESRNDEETAIIETDKQQQPKKKRKYRKRQQPIVRSEYEPEIAAVTSTTTTVADDTTNVADDTTNVADDTTNVADDTTTNVADDTTCLTNDDEDDAGGNDIFINNSIFTSSPPPPPTASSTAAVTYACDYCPNKYNNKGALWQHSVAAHSIEKTCECQLCGRKFYRNCSLALHMKCHTDEQQCRCKICGFEFSRLSMLEKHSKYYHSETQPSYTCKVCNKKFTDQANLQRHASYHNDRYSCDMCNVTFNGKQLLQLHFNMTHNAGLKLFICKVCKVRFDNQKDLIKHSRSHSNNNSNHHKNNNKNSGGKVFVDRSSSNTGGGGGIIACQYCSETFVQKAAYKKHLQSHVGDRLRCDICRIDFTQRSSLLRHLKKLHGINTSHLGNMNVIRETIMKNGKFTNAVGRKASGRHINHTINDTNSKPIMSETS